MEVSVHSHVILSSTIYLLHRETKDWRCRYVRSAVTTATDVGEELIVHQSLDTGAELPPSPAPMEAQTVDADYARTVAAVLLTFLRSLPESVVPLSLHQSCTGITSRDEAMEVRYNRFLGDRGRAWSELMKPMTHMTPKK